MNILGVSFKAHDRSACIVRDGRLLAAVEEERLNRDKHTGTFPQNAIFEVLRITGMTPDDIDLVAYGGEGKHPIDRPQTRSRSQVASLYTTNVRLRNQQEVDRIRTFMANARSRPADLVCVDHETAHLASAALCSGFDACTAVAVDGYGDDKSGAVGAWHDDALHLIAPSPLRSSVGLVYGMTTLLLGMTIWHDEGKVTALSSFPPQVPEHIRELYRELLPEPEGCALRPNAEKLLAWLDSPAPPAPPRHSLHPSETVRPSLRWRPERTEDGYVLRSPTGTSVPVRPLSDDEFRALWYVLRRTRSAHVAEVIELATPLVGMCGERLVPNLLPTVALRARNDVFSANLGKGLVLRLTEQDHAVYSRCDGSMSAGAIAEEIGVAVRDVRDLVEFSPLCRTLWTGGRAPGSTDAEGFAQRATSAFGTWLACSAVERAPLGHHSSTFIDASQYAAVRRRLLDSTSRSAVAKALQERFEHVLTSLVTQAVERTGQGRVAVAGGVFFNVLGNMRLRCEVSVDELFVQPAAGDAGTSVGAALMAWADHCQRDGVPVSTSRLENVSLGPAYERDEVRKAFEGTRGIAWEETDDMAGSAADLVADGRIVGWFQGRMEFGPRALGNRSVLADPADPLVKDRINLLLKGREWFQPFCPSLPLERACEYLVEGRDAPFMIQAFEVPEDKRLEIPAVVHADGTTRPQTVRKELMPEYHRLLTQLESRTGVPVVLNTSFNLHGEPIVCTPRDALSVLLRRGIDVLVMEGFIARRSH